MCVCVVVVFVVVVFFVCVCVFACVCVSSGQQHYISFVSKGINCSKRERFACYDKASAVQGI